MQGQGNSPLPPLADTELASSQAAPWSRPTVPSDGPPSAERPDWTATGASDSAGRYVLGEVFARGGIGCIRRAYDTHLERLVAAKELLLSGSESLERRFLREAKITAQLQHPAVVPVYDLAVRTDGSAFICMKLVQGKPLDKVISGRDRFVDRLELLPHVIAVCDAIAYAHKNGIIHRDIKPSNVLIGDFGETVVIDWGLAKKFDDTEPLEATEDLGERTADATRAGTLLGTLAYMPPEQARGEVVDYRADVYSLGALLYEVLTGRPPFTAASSGEILHQLLREGPPDVRQLVPKVPPELAVIVVLSMERDPDKRAKTAVQMAQELRQYQTGRLVDSYRYSNLELVAKWVKRHKGMVTLGLAALGAITLTTALAYGEVAHQRDLARSHQRAAESASQEALVRGDEARALATKFGTELARRDLLEKGRPLHALPVLLQAYEAAPESIALRSLLSDALRPASSLIADLPGHRRGARSAEFSSDASILATEDRETIIVWGTNDGAERWRRAGPFRGPLALRFLRDTHTLVVCEPRRINLIDIDLNTERWYEVPCHSISGDGTRALYEENGEVIVFDVGAGAEIARKAVAESAVGHVFDTVISRGGEIALAQVRAGKPRGFNDGDVSTLVVLHLDDNMRQVEIPDDILLFAHPVLSPDARFIVTLERTAGDAAVPRHRGAVWMASNGALASNLVQFPATYGGAAFTPDGSYLSLLSSDGYITSYSTKDWQPAARVPSERGVLGAPAFGSADDEILVAGRDGVVRRHSIHTGSVTWSIDAHTAELTLAETDQRDRYLITSDSGGRTRLWTRADKREGSISHDIRRLSSDRRILALARGARVEFFAKSIKSPLGAIELAESIKKIQLARDGDRALLVTSSGAVAYVKNILAGRPRVERMSALDSWCEASFGGDAVLLTGRSKRIGVWRPEEAGSEVTSEIDMRQEPCGRWRSERLLLDGRVFLQYNHSVDDRVVKTLGLWDLRSGEKIGEYRDVVALHELESKDGIRAIVGAQVLTWMQGDNFRTSYSTQDSSLHGIEGSWYADEFPVLGRINGGANYLVDQDLIGIELVGPEKHLSNSLVTEDQRLIGLEGNHVFIWGMSTGALLTELSAPEFVGAGYFSPPAHIKTPQQDLVAVGGNDGVVHVWDIDSGGLLHRLEAHSDRVMRLAFDETGARLVTSGFDGQAIVWAMDTGDSVATVPSVVDDHNTAAFDGDRLMIPNVTSMDLWDVTLESRSPQAILELLVSKGLGPR